LPLRSFQDASPVKKPSNIFWENDKKSGNKWGIPSWESNIYIREVPISAGGSAKQSRMMFFVYGHGQMCFKLFMPESLVNH
jgi:hypothetical protein